LHLGQPGRGISRKAVAVMNALKITQNNFFVVIIRDVIDNRTEAGKVRVTHIPSVVSWL